MLLIVVVGTLLVTSLVPGAGAPPSAGAQPNAEVLRIASVSPWVAPDGEFQVRFEPSTMVPPDAELTVTIHQSVSGTSLRDEVAEILDGDAPGRILRRLDTVAFSELGDPTAGSALRVPVRARRADSERILVPNSGIHPVHLVLTEPDGPELWSRVVFLNRLPSLGEDDEPAPPVEVSLLLPFGSGAAIGPDGTGAFDVEERTALTSIAALLDDVPEAPITLLPRPNTLDGLELTDEPWAREVLDAVAAPDAVHGLLALPYTDLDIGGVVAAGAGDQLAHQVDLGAQTVARVGGREPVQGSLVFDGTVTEASLAGLARTGIRSLVVSPDALELPSDLDVDDVTTRPARVSDSSIRALAVDAEISGYLAERGTDPGARAHEVVTMWMATWFDHSDQQDEIGPASAVLMTAATDPGVLRALAPSLSGDGPLRADPSTSPVPDPQPTSSSENRGKEDEPRVSLRSRRPADQHANIRELTDTRRLTDAYRSMTGEGDPRLWALERVNDQSLSASLDGGRRLELHHAVRQVIRDNVALIEPPSSRRVVVTSRDTTIPLRFRNGLDFDVELVLRARSPRLEIDGGRSRRVVLHPGENRIDLPVTVKAPGESLLRLSLESPVAGVVLDGPNVPVRSTAISGVGAALSIVSVTFLIGWWIHTHRQKRRREALQSGAHPSAEVSPDSLSSGG